MVAVRGEPGVGVFGGDSSEERVEVAAMRHVLEECRDEFNERVLTPREVALLERAHDPAETLARIVAAKAAATRALRTLDRRRVVPGTLEVLDPGARHGVVRVLTGEGPRPTDGPLEVEIILRATRALVSARPRVTSRLPGPPRSRWAQATRVR